MTRTVREAAMVLTAIAGSDPADPATREADARKTDYAAALSPNSLRGRRIGVTRFATGFGTNPGARGGASNPPRPGRDLVDIDKFEGRGQIGQESYKVLLAEFKADLNAYLATTPATVPHPHAEGPDRLQRGQCGNRDAPVRPGHFRRFGERPRASTTRI
jgi:amidase